MKDIDVVLTPLSADEISDRIREVYETSFPPEERRRADAMIPSDPEFSFFKISTPGADEAGLITLWKFKDFTYIEHFATAPGLRGRGIGAAVLAKIPGTLVLEVEPPGSTPEASRRIDFYRRQGFRLHSGFHYVQPPYSPGLPSVALCLMSRGSLACPLEDVAATLHRRVYGI